MDNYIQTFTNDFYVSYYIWHAYMISISVFSIFMCQCIYLMSLLLYMLKIVKKMNIFCLFKYLSWFADFCRFFPPMLPRRCFLDPRRFFADADVFYYDYHHSLVSALKFNKGLSNKYSIGIVTQNEQT